MNRLRHQNYKHEILRKNTQHICKNANSKG